MMKMSLVLLVIMAITWSTSSAQSNSCTNVLISLSPCLNYISGNSSSTPSSNCCSQLATVVGAQPECLCQVLNGGAPGLNINRTLALALPAACKVNTPSLSNCKTGGSPTGAPDGSSSGNPTVTSTDNDGSSDGSSIRMSSYLVLVVVMAASYVSTLSV